MKPFSQADFYKSCSLATVNIIFNLVSGLGSDKYCREKEMETVLKLLVKWRARLEGGLDPVSVGEDLSEPMRKICGGCHGISVLALDCNICNGAGSVVGPKDSLKSITVNGVAVEIVAAMVSYEQVVELSEKNINSEPTVCYSGTSSGDGMLIPGYAIAVRDGMNFNVVGGELV